MKERELPSEFKEEELVESCTKSQFMHYIRFMHYVQFANELYAVVNNRKNTITNDEHISELNLVNAFIDHLRKRGIDVTER